MRVGLIGGGGIATVHIDGYLRNPDVAVVAAVSDIDPATAQRRADELGAQAFTNFEEMLDTVELDAVDICLPHHLHARAIIAAVERGLHVLCEKPLCTEPDEVLAIEAALRESTVFVMPAHNQLFRPVVREAHRLISSGVLGDLYSVSLTCSFRLGLDAQSAGWRGDARAAGGGELIDSGFHPLYLLGHLIPEQPQDLFAVLSKHRLHFLPGEDSAEVVVRYPSGTIGKVSTSWAYEPATGTETLAVAGSLGSIFGSDTELIHVDADGTRTVHVLPPADTFADEIRHFAAAVLAGTEPVQTATHGIAALTLVRAAQESHETGARVVLGGAPA